MQITNDTLNKVIEMSGSSSEEMLNLFVISACETYLKKQVTFDNPEFDVRKTDLKVGEIMTDEFINKIKAMRRVNR